MYATEVLVRTLKEKWNIEYYPRMQVNIILDRHGYYVIDFIETRKGSRPNKKQVLDEFSKTIKKRTFPNIENMSDF